MVLYLITSWKKASPAASAAGAMLVNVLQRLVAAVTNRRKG